MGVAYTNNIARKVAIVTNMSLNNNVMSSLALLIGGGRDCADRLAFRLAPADKRLAKIGALSFTWVWL